MTKLKKKYHHHLSEKWSYTCVIWRNGVMYTITTTHQKKMSVTNEYMNSRRISDHFGNVDWIFLLMYALLRKTYNTRKQTPATTRYQANMTTYERKKMSRMVPFGVKNSSIVTLRCKPEAYRSTHTRPPSSLYVPWYNPRPFDPAHPLQHWLRSLNHLFSYEHCEHRTTRNLQITQDTKV